MTKKQKEEKERKGEKKGKKHINGGERSHNERREIDRKELLDK